MGRRGFFFWLRACVCTRAYVCVCACLKVRIREEVQDLGCVKQNQREAGHNEHVHGFECWSMCTCLRVFARVCIHWSCFERICVCMVCTNRIG